MKILSNNVTETVQKRKSYAESYHDAVDAPTFKLTAYNIAYDVSSPLPDERADEWLCRAVIHAPTYPTTL